MMRQSRVSGNKRRLFSAAVSVVDAAAACEAGRQKQSKKFRT
jgi:hypothetical protein